MARTACSFKLQNCDWWTLGVLTLIKSIFLAMTFFVSCHTTTLKKTWITHILLTFTTSTTVTRRLSFETMLQVTGLPLGTWIVEGLDIVCCKFGSFSMRHRSSLGCWPEIFFNRLSDVICHEALRVSGWGFVIAQPGVIFVRAIAISYHILKCHSLTLYRFLG